MRNTILPGLTTTAGSDWRGKVEETKRFNLTKIALFPTALEKKDRLELYSLLEKSPVTEIFHIHLRAEDMDKAEIEYLIQRYKTRYFNIHPISDDEIIAKFKKFSEMTCIENLSEIGKTYENAVREFPSLCVDFTHFEKGLLAKAFGYENFEKIMSAHQIRCCHLGAFNTDPDDCGHYLHNFEELNFIKKYQKYLPKYCSLELENTFEEQLQCIRYLDKILEQ